MFTVVYVSRVKYFMFNYSNLLSNLGLSRSNMFRNDKGVQNVIGARRAIYCVFINLSLATILRYGSLVGPSAGNWKRRNREHPSRDIGGHQIVRSVCLFFTNDE